MAEKSVQKGSVEKGEIEKLSILLSLQLQHQEYI